MKGKEQGKDQNYPPVPPNLSMPSHRFENVFKKTGQQTRSMACNVNRILFTVLSATNRSPHIILNHPLIPHLRIVRILSKLPLGAPLA